MSSDLNNMEFNALVESIGCIDNILVEEGIVDPIEREQIAYLCILLSRCMHESNQGTGDNDPHVESL